VALQPAYRPVECVGCHALAVAVGIGGGRAAHGG